MNKRSAIVLVGLMALIAAFGLTLAGCENAAQEVEGTVGIKTGKAPAPGNVTAVKATTNVDVAFDLVDNAAGYRLYAKKEGSKLLTEVYGASVVADNRATVTFTAAPTITTGDWRIGVQTNPLITAGPLDTASDVAWSEVFNY
jgi:uncharacterized lipoprotein NlpE involved in copper resistance